MKWHYYVLTFSYCAFIFWLSHRELPVDPDLQVSGADKVAHMAMFGLLAAMVSVGMRRSGKPVPPVRQFMIPFLFASFYGVTDEIHQAFVPAREFDVWDIVANTAGAFFMQVFLCGAVWRLPVKTILTRPWELSAVPADQE